MDLQRLLQHRPPRLYVRLQLGGGAVGVDHRPEGVREGLLVGPAAPLALVVAPPDLRLPLEYKGFIEGDDIGKGTVDVVVTEGFTGNIALKTAEGTAKQLSTYLKLVLNRTLLSRLGALLATGAFATLRERMDPRKHNGGVFLGLNGIVVKSHGGTDALGFATAVDVAIEMVKNGLVAKIAADVAEMNRHMDAFTPPAAVNA